MARSDDPIPSSGAKEGGGWLGHGKRSRATRDMLVADLQSLGIPPLSDEAPQARRVLPGLPVRPADP
jgi:hypothetical protein